MSEIIELPVKLDVPPKIGVVVVDLGSREHLLLCLQSLFLVLKDLEVEICLVILNGNKEYDEMYDRQGVHVIHAHDSGWSQGCNQALKTFSSNVSVLLFLSSDLIFLDSESWEALFKESVAEKLSYGFDSSLTVMGTQAFYFFSDGFLLTPKTCFEKCGGWDERVFSTGSILNMGRILEQHGLTLEKLPDGMINRYQMNKDSIFSDVRHAIEFENDFPSISKTLNNDD